MALFSRRKKADRPSGAAADAPADSPLDSAPDTVGPAHEPTAAADPDGAASVGISVSTYRGAGGAPAAPRKEPRARAEAEAPAPSESIAGLRDNVLLRQALGALTDPPTPPGLLNVARQLLQGHLFLRVKGDARALLAEGRGLPLAVTRRGEKQLVLAFSSGAALQAAVDADKDTDTSAVAQPVLTVLKHVLDGPYDGLVIDPASSPARAVLPRPLVQRAVDEAHPTLAIKTLLAAPRTAQTAGDVVAALLEAPLWIAVRRTEGGPVGIAESRTTEGERYIDVFSHPLEVLALSRGDQPLPVTAAQLSKAVQADEGVTGLVLDPGGPWIRLRRDDLAPLRALA